MQSRYSNELNSFRQSIEARTQQHKNKIDAVNQALGFKADKVFENAKKLSDAGGKLVEAGIGVAGVAPALGKYARKGLTRYAQFKNSAQDAVDKVTGKVEGKVENVAENVEGKVQQGVDNISGKASELNPGESVDQIAARMKQQTFDAQNARDSVPAEENTGGANQSVGGNAEQAQPSGEPRFTNTEGKADDDMDAEQGGAFDENNPTAQAEQLDQNITKLRTGGLGGEGKPAQVRYSEQLKDSSTDETTDTTAENTADTTAETTADNTADTLVDTTADTVADLTTDTALTSASVGLEEGAAATSWLAFLGIPEVLAAIGAVTGAVSAGYGIADAVKAGSATTAAKALPTTVADTGTQVAGQYVTPTMDSVS